MQAPPTETRARIYKLVDPLPSTIVYIGRTIRPLEARRKEHLSQALDLARPSVYDWIRSLLKEHREPAIVELECVAVSQAIAAEDAWMQEYRARGFTVLNQRSSRSGPLLRDISQQKWIQRWTGHQYKGVSRSGKKWRAMMVHKGIYQNLGSHETPEEAARAYDRAAIALFGPSAFLNLPDERESTQP